MKLLTAPDGEALPAIAVFGAGLLGRAIAGRAAELAGMAVETWPLDWLEAEAQAAQLEAIGERLSALPAGPRDRPALTVLWSAGQAGFMAQQAEVEAELESFRRVVALLARLPARLRSPSLPLHLISSAGGLFEGQLAVDATAEPAPKRPYGVLKLRQEELAAAAGSWLAPRVYRLSTCYGMLCPGQRVGLVSAMLLAGMRQEVVTVIGKMSTLRDFVSAVDVGHYLAPRLLADSGESRPSATLLARGRPSALYEVAREVEVTLGHRLYVSFSPRATNAEDTTFARSALPRDWQPRTLREGLRQVYRAALSSGVAFTRGGNPGRT